MNYEQEPLHINTAFVNHCSCGHLDLAELCINKAGVDVNARHEMTDETGLMAACQGGHIKIVSYLLEKGADVNAKQRCPLWKGSTALMKASEKGNAEVVKILLEKGAYVNIADQKGNTPLIHAVKAVSEVVVKMLLDKGANVNQIN